MMKEWFSKLDTTRRAFIGLSAFYVLFVGYKFLSYYLPTRKAVEIAESGQADVADLYKNDPSLFYTIANLSAFEAKTAFYQSLLIWGVVAIGIISFFLFFKSRRNA
jgi:hypothetical protein